MNDQLRAAAKRLVARWYDSYGETEEGCPQAYRDAIELATACLAEPVPEDDAEPLTDPWLRLFGSLYDCGDLSIGPLSFMFSCQSMDGPGELEPHNRGVRKTLRTRGDVRRLFAAMGIKP